jgi:flagellar protein FliO/FliZ
MQFLTSLFGGSENTYLTAALALGIVLVLIVLGLWALKLLTKATGNVGRTGRRRLTVVDSMMLDPKRQLLIIRRDNVEHLILTGGPQDVVVETGIPVQAQPAPVRRPIAVPPPQQQQRAPQRTAEIPAAIAAKSAEEAPQRSAMERLRDFGRPHDQRRSSSLRHTGLMRPVTRMEPGMIASIAENSDHLIADSAKEGRVERLDSHRNGDGQGKGGEKRKGAGFEDGRSRN